MIQINDKKDCCGCGACVQRCPKQCIAMCEDEEGFLYPHVDAATCIDCSLCEKVCPVIHRDAAREPQSVYAAKNPDEEIRRQSSSGGVFTLLAEGVIARGGVVFGARFNEAWEVEHGYTETVEGLAAFRGSKYVQSRTGDSFRWAEAFLKTGREVLFSGTPCQVAGLRRFLRKDYPNLLTVDFICHGVPSPGVWRNYLHETCAEVARQGDGKNSVSTHPLRVDDVRIADISFRDKRLGWKKYSFSLTLSVPGGHGAKNTVFRSEVLTRNAYMRGFLSDIYLRPSCYACAAKELRSGSDLTLGDYWGIASLMPELDDDRGVSAITVNTERGRTALATTGAELHATPYAELYRRNPALLHSCAEPAKRAAFYARSSESVAARVADLCRPTLRQRLFSMLRAALQRLGLLKQLRTLKHKIKR